MSCSAACKARHFDKLWIWKTRATQRYRDRAEILQQKLKKVPTEGKANARRNEN